MRIGEFARKTNETDVRIELNLDGTGKAEPRTGIGFFDHMLTALAVHSGFDLAISCKGDLEVDGHHTVEDVGIAMGRAFAAAVGDKTGIARYGSFALPMDEALAVCAVDVGGRAYSVFDADFRAERIGDLDTQLIGEFFTAFAVNAAVTLHLNVRYGENDHHKCEALFKACAHALKAATRVGGTQVLSSKGTIA
ncbi:MAG: imidazoleglycerol-phosphate dehydratase HisB [Clostridiales Family XIII bacterium]|jgi:imidazoleglycerol-phosphate dehydratase|nr:imidazoleglycerol-phosphate dehydratase HisB [Clostridiales Family XIII bacterium]